MKCKCHAAPLAEGPQAGPGWQEQGVDVDIRTMYFLSNILMYTIITFHIVILFILNGLHVCGLLRLPVCVTSRAYEHRAAADRQVLLTHP